MVPSSIRGHRGIINGVWATMQTHTETRAVYSNGVSRSASFGMLTEHSAHIFNILRSTLYSDKVLAVLREYGANAWDEHRAAGIPDRPIKVDLPTTLDPVLRIRDYGRGLSESQVFDVYTKYGASTKRDTDDAVGCLGIGSKSAFAYTDSFSVTSWHGGAKSIYFAILDETNVGRMSLMHREPCAPDETGVEISIQVALDDCELFERRAAKIFPYFRPKPETRIQIDNPPATTDSLLAAPQSIYNRTQAKWTAVMGCIPYNVDLECVQTLIAALNCEFIAGQSGILYFNIGEVDVSASRETLEYTQRTKDAIKRKIESLVSHVRVFINEVRNDPTLTPWQRELKLLDLRNQYGKFVDPIRYSIRLKSPDGVPQHFMLRSVDNGKFKNAQDAIAVHPQTRIIFRDINRALSRVETERYDVFCIPAGRANMDNAFAQLNEVVAASGATGVPILRFSELPYTPTVHATDRKLKATDAFFTFRDKSYHGYNFKHPSKNWELCEAEPTSNDLYIMLDKFRPDNEHSFVNRLYTDKLILNWLGVDIPPIYGYRKVANSPEPIGVPYSTWRKTAIVDALSKNAEKTQELDNYRRAMLLANFSRSYSYRAETQSNYAQYLVDALPAGTVLHDFMSKLATVVPVGRETLLQEIHGLVPDPYADIIDSIYNRYPILSQTRYGPGLDVLFRVDYRDMWISYIQLAEVAYGSSVHNHK